MSQDIKNGLKEQLKKIYGKEATLLESNDTFYAGCNKCGKCCIDRNDITIKINDLRRLAIYLNTTTVDVVIKYMNVYPGKNSFLPQMIIDMEGTACPFLKEDKDETFICSVNDAKPDVCAIYPLGRAFSNIDSESNENEVFYFLPGGKKDSMVCLPPAEQKEIKLEEWIDIDRAKIDLKWNNAFIKKIRAISDLDSKALEKAAHKPSLFTGLMMFLYETNLDVSELVALDEYADLNHPKNLHIMKDIIKIALT